MNNQYIIDDSTIKFGRYPQSMKGDIKPIEWDILMKMDGKALLISHYVLDAMSFDEKSNNYKNSSIRKWLNDTFYNIAFSDNEKRIIEITEVDNGSLSTRYQNNHYACSNTNDKIFLLSRHEATLYGIINFSKIHGLEDFKKAQGTYFAEGQGLSSFRCYCCWWLRSPSCTSSEHAMMVDFDGGMDYELDIKSKDCGVRPAMWIKL